MPIRRSFQRLARLLKPRRPVRRADRLRQRPFLEYLESRTVPTTLFVRGDQPGPGFPDVIDLDVTDSGGVRVTLNGQVSEFAPGQFTDVSVQSGGGNDLVHVLRTVVPVSINSTGNARVIAGVNGTVGGIQAGVTITNSISRSTVEVDDSADAAFQTLTISTVSVAGGAGRRVAFAGVAPIDSQDSSTRTLTVDTGTAGAQVNMQNSSTKPVSLVVHADNTNLSITSGLITLNGPQTIHDLTLTGGELRGSGDLTVSGTLTWNGGTLRGPGRTIAQATMLLGGGDKFLVGRGLVNTATATWTAGTVFASRAAALANQAGALFDLQSDGALSSVFDTTSVFTNTGTLRKSAGSGITTLGIPFNNAGAVEVNSGTLNVGNGTSSGSFTVAQGNTLQFFVGTHLLGAASVVTGDGTVRFGSGAIVTVAGTYNVANTVIDLGTVSFDADNSITNLTLGFGGTLTGSATLTVVGPITWTGGTMTGTGRTVAQSGLAIVGPNDKVLAGRALDNFGEADWTGGGFIIRSATVINNMPGAVFDIQTDGHLLASGTESAFNNAGTLRKSAGTGLSQLFLLPVNSSGAVEVLIGTLELAGGGNSSGSFTVQAGATLTFSNGPHVLALASSITGAGQVHFASAGAGATVYIFGSYAITGGTTVALGTVFFFTSAPGQLGALTISGGSTAIFSDATADSLAESDGNLAGTATLTVTGLTTWSGGTMGGGGRTIAAGGLRLTSAFPKILDDRIIDNQADAVWSDGDLRGGGFRGGVINNLPGATFDIQAAGVAFDGPTFNNFGTLRKSAGAGTVSFNAVLNNTGTVELRVGTLTVTGNFIQTDGSTTLAGGTLSAAGGLSLLGGTLSGSGTIIGNVTNAASIIVGDATTLGTLTINGSYTQTSAGNLTLKLGGIASGQFDRLVVSNTAALAGTLTVRLVNGYSPASGDSLRVLTAGSLSGTFGVLAGDGPLFDPLYDTTGLALRRR